jgi:hypothetical protein
MRVAAPGRGTHYIIRESSPYSLALDDGLGFSLKSITKAITKPFKKVAKVAFKVVKNVAAFQLNLFTLGAASKFTSVSKWGGAKTAGKLGTVAGFTMAAVAGAAVAAGAVGGAGAAGVTGAAGTAGTTGVTGVTSGAGWLSILGTGTKVASALAVPAMTLLKGGAPAPGPVPLQNISGQGIVPMYTGGGGSSGEGGFYSGGAYVPGSADGEVMESQASWLPLLLIGAIGVVLITKRR